MGINLVVAVTDDDWFEMLRSQSSLSEVNFWAPSAANFRALQPGELFLFKLHSPRNVIVGGGIFAYANTLPCSLAWNAFGEGNGARSAQEMRTAESQSIGVQIPVTGATLQWDAEFLTQPFFFEEADWLPLPASWSPNIVSFKTYDTSDAEGLALWEAVMDRLSRSAAPIFSDHDRFGEPQLIKPRLGQGAFRVLVTDIYGRRCAVTQERTLPALEAAHIRPYSDGGTHEAPNGLLLRRDIHSLFDAGYVTITPGLNFEVSRRIKDEFDNGKHYYALHGQRIIVPENAIQRPDPTALTWHNEHCFKG